MSVERQNFPRHPHANPKAVVGGKDGQKYRFTVLTKGLVRFEYSPDSKFNDLPTTFAIHRDLPVPEFRVVETDQDLEIITEKFHLRYDKKTFTPSGLTAQVKGNITDWKSLWRYGGGIKEEQMQLGGTARTLDEANGRIPLERGILATNGYGSIDDSHTMVFTDDGWIDGRHGTQNIDGYLFAFGFDYKQAMKDFFAVSGHQPLLPRWSLGNWWSRYFRYTEKTYLELMDRFKSENLPFSVAVLDMDWHWVADERVEKSDFSGWTGYSWDTNVFPDPKGFLTKMHDRGLKICPNDHPADGVASYEDMYKAMCHATGRDPNTRDPIPFSPSDKKFLDAYFDVLLRKLEDDGIDFWWVDWQQGPYSGIPGVDPLWVLNHYHFLNNSRENKRPLTFSRYAGPGSHRYPVGFSGDSVVTWESLDFQPEFTATASNIGYGWWSHDIGGHMNGYRDDELATRWVQLGVWSPILRLHSSNNAWNAKEPWRFIPEARSAMNDALRLRHKLIPYIYSMNALSATEGAPLVQPMYWKYPQNGNAFAYKNTYTFGTQLFVVPMTQPRDKVTRRSGVEAWVPPGRHVDIFSGRVYDGDRKLKLFRQLDEYAVLAPEGAIVPLDASEQPDNSTANPKSLEVLVVVGKDGEFTMYEDDGMGANVDTVEWVKTPIAYSQQSGSLTIGPAKGDLKAIPKEREWKILFISLDEHADVKASIDGKDADAKLEKTDRGISIALPATATTSTLTVSITTSPSASSTPSSTSSTPTSSSPSSSSGPQLRVRNAMDDAYTLLNDAQMSFDRKGDVWSVLEDRSKPLVVRLAGLRGLGVDANLEAAMSECLSADARWQG